MRRKLILFIGLLTIFLLVACGKKDSVESIEKETEKENEITGEEIKEINWYDASLDENIYWDGGRATCWDTIDNGFGKIGYYDTAGSILRGEEKTTGAQLLPVCVEEASGKSYSELYEKYVKPLNVKTDFYGVDDEEILSALTEMEEYRLAINKNREYDTYYSGYTLNAGMVIFITSDEFIKLYEAGCPKDMKIIFTWLEDGQYTRFDKKMKNYECEVIYSKYKEDLFNRKLIWYDGNTELDYDLVYSEDGKVCWPNYLQEMFDEAKEICDESSSASEIYPRMKYVINVSIKTKKDLKYINDEFVSKLHLEWNRKSMLCEDDTFSCVVYLTEEEILTFESLDVFENTILLEPAIRPEKMTMTRVMQELYKSILYELFEDYSVDSYPVYCVDEESGKVIHEYSTETSIWEKKNEGKEVYWDWDLMYKQFWSKDNPISYAKADYFRSDLIWFLSTDETGMPGGYMVETDTKGVHTSTYVYSQFEFARTKYNSEKKPYKNMKYAMDIKVKTTHDTDYLYDNYIKIIGVETQFDGMTDEEAKAWLREKYNEKYNYPDGANWFEFKVYITEEEFYQIKPFEEYLSVLISDREEEFKLTEKYIDIYEYELIPVTYLDQETREMKQGFFTKNEARQLVKEPYVYWDWELMNKQMWE